MWPDLSGAHRRQQQSRQLRAQRRGDGQDERRQARGAEEIAILEAQLHVPAAEPGSVARQRLFDRQIRRQTSADAAAALDHV